MKVVLAHGVFDLLHLGHIRHLEEAKSFGDKLIVSVTPDEYVNKGIGRPHFTAAQRVEALKALSFVDEVFIADGPTASSSISKVKPAVYVKGPDYADGKNPYHKADAALVKRLGGETRLTTAGKWSSSSLLRSIKLPTETLEYLEQARKADFYDRILDAFDKADKLNILFVGETIIDRYRYVRPLAKPSKEFILATVFDREDIFDGGVIAASKHGGWNRATVYTGTQPIEKIRYVDADFSRKLFEVYSATKVTDYTEWSVKGFDVVIALDFGHGFFDQTERFRLREAKFLAITAQSNAGNYGYNPITKYHHADYVCLDEPEARLAIGKQDGTPANIIEAVALRLTASAATMTRGRYGSVSYDGTIKPVPAFVHGGIDTIGAGDAFITITAPLLATGLPVELASFAGNVAGGLKTIILGHSTHVTRDDLIQNIRWLLK